MKRNVLGTNRAHRVYTIIGLAWPVFGVIFISLLCSTAWFSLEPLHFFPLVCLFALFCGYLLALLLSSDAATRLVAFFKRGTPLLVFRRFLVLELDDENGDTLVACTFGRRRILTESISALHLSLLGTLELHSQALSGAAGDDHDTDVVLRLPFSAIDLESQKALVALFKAAKPDIVISERLEKRLSSPILRGQMLLSMMGAAVITFALFDVGYAGSLWLSMLRAHYGARVLATHAAVDERAFFASTGLSSEALYQRAEELRLHPFPLSWAYRALFDGKNSRSQLDAIRAETLFVLGSKAEAAELARQVVAGNPSGFRNQLALARYLSALGRDREAREVLSEVLKKHEDVLMPAVYRLALTTEEQRAATYSEDLERLDKAVYGVEPAWPPGGEKPVMEMWRRDDLLFIAHRLLGLK